MDNTTSLGDMVATERVTVIVLELAKGRALSTAEIAALTGLTMNGAWLMMTKISRVAPVYQQNGVWILAHIH